MAWLLILGVAVLLVGLVLLAGGKQASRSPVPPSPVPPRRRDSGGSGVWIGDYSPTEGLQLDKFGYPVDAAGLISDDDSSFESGGGSGGGGGASGSWDDGGSDGGGD